MNYVKAIAIILIILGIIYGITTYGNNRYQAGIDHQIAEQANASKKVENSALEEVKKKLSTVTKEKQEWQLKADKLSRIKPGVIHDTKIINVDTCRNRGDEYVRLWNDRNSRFLLGVSIAGE